MDAKTFDPIWEEIYAAGKQLNRYPFSSIVSFYFRNCPSADSTELLKVLEIGCGAGNNLWFLAEEGCAVTGIDASQSAIEFARNRFQKAKLPGRFLVEDFTAMPFEEGSFDMVIERAALTQTGFSVAKRAVSEVHRVLKSGCLFYSEIYSDRASSRGRELTDGLMVVTEGPYQDVGQICFYNRKRIRDLFGKCEWTIESMTHTETVEVEGKSGDRLAHWSITARK